MAELLFPSQEWLDRFREEINKSEEYKKSGATWEAGPITFVVKKKPEIGLNEDIAMWIHLHKGECKSAKIVPIEEGHKAPFVITGEYERWKQIINKEIEPIKGMVQGKLKLKGHLPTIVKYVKASQDLVECATRVPTKFLG